MPAYEHLPDDYIWKLVLRVREISGLPAGSAQGQGQGPTKPGAGKRTSGVVLADEWRCVARRATTG